MLAWFLAAPVAIIVRACTSEEICKEPREYCRSQGARFAERARRGNSTPAQRAANFALQKLFYLPTCEFCLSFWVALAVVMIADYRIHFSDWRGAALACFVVMGVANVYMSLFSQIRVDSRKDRALADNLEQKRGP